jgi:hypothetical protein
MSKTSMVGPLGGDTEDLRVPTTCVKDVNGGAPTKRCRRCGSAHHWAALVVVPVKVPLRFGI